jgi:hypothetical protein
MSFCVQALTVWSSTSSDFLIPKGCLDYVGPPVVVTGQKELVEYVDEVYRVARETRKDDLDRLVRELSVKKNVLDENLLKGMIVMRHLIQ